MSSSFFQDHGAGGKKTARSARVVRSAPSTASLAELVNPLQGTDSHHAFSTGNTLPLVALPHGMVAWTPQTDEGRWIYDYRAPKLQAFRATHQPSPWMADYGQFMVMATSGDRAPANYDDTSSFYRKTDTVSRPHYFRTVLHRFGIEAELTPTERGASFRFTYREGAHAWIAFKLGAGDLLRVDRAQRRVYGVSTANSGGVPGNFGAHFVADIGAEILDAGTPAPVVASQPNQAEPAWLWLKLKRPANRQVTVRIATSFISEAQAVTNLQRELGTRSFPALLAAAKKTWDTRLAVIEIEGASEAQQRTFYSCLYRCLLFPRMWHEFDATGAKVHFSPFSGKVHPGPLFTDIGFWDVHRTLLPLLTIIAPDLLGEMIEGWVNTYREGGWLPSWASPGYRTCMVGSHSNAVIADAYAKGIRNFDVAAAYAAIRQDALVEPPSEAVGRAGITDYIKFGFVPSDHFGHAVARTTDYAHCDFALGDFARALGHADDAKLFTGRALSYRKVFDARTGFLRGRNADGKWRTPFSEFEWSRDYIEGSAWQHTWAVPHDAAGLIKLMGGTRAFVAKLDRMLALPPRFEIGNYATEIHEMTEMAAADFGQYAHSNQPVHHVLYLYTCAGRPDRTQHWVRRVVDELYTPDLLPGDEDNGEMAAWYVLSTLGLFPLTVGYPAYVLGAPRFPRAKINLRDGGQFTIETVGDVEKKNFARAVELNGKTHRSLELAHTEIKAGATLTFHLTDQATTAAARGKLAPPFSLSLR
ncbi:GH92 family glycosyl hydrolase [Oleiharenicola lentus]|uniref:GH92 family glycosyl hydrolase n=1 Tax=Oleiharenicola lentus TaxID=2508720 RepID=UPI003F6705EE